MYICVYGFIIFGVIVNVKSVKTIKIICIQ